VPHKEPETQSLLSAESVIENTPEFIDTLNMSMRLDHWSDVLDKLFPERLEADLNRNRFDGTFTRCVDLEQNFLTLSASQNIDYINLGDFMALVFEEFTKAYESKVPLD